jgi:nicotinate dehydrogenase subunit B
VKSGIGKDGRVIAWDFHNYNSGMSAIETPYDVANYQTAFHLVHSPLRQGSYRGLAATANTFARETHMDELAQLAKVEPLEFRMRNLSDPRLRAVLEAGAKTFAWAGKEGAIRAGIRSHHRKRKGRLCCDICRGYDEFNSR